jgi:hypothetical protein
MGAVFDQDVPGHRFNAGQGGGREAGQEENDG